MQDDVVVIGAGLAGLQTARLLTRAGQRVRVLEARERVGGRTFSTQVDDAVFDLGGQWIGRSHRRLKALAAELGLATYPQYTQGRRVMDVDGLVHTYAGTIPRLAPWKLLQMQAAMTRLGRLVRTVDPRAPMAGCRAAELDSLSVEHIARRWLWSRAPRSLFAAAARMIFGAELSDVSLLYFLSYLQAGGGFEELIETKHGAQESKFVGGAQGLSLAIARELGSRVETDSPVRAICQDDSGVSVVTDRQSYRARFAVLAIPPALRAQLRFTPMLPVLHDQLTQRAPMGATVKAIVTYDRPFWREANLCGEAVCDRGPVSTTFDATPHGEARPALVAFIVGQQARTWSLRSAPERREAVLAALSRCFGEAALRPRAFRDQDWSTEPWTRGCPVAALGTGVLSSCAAALREPIGRVHIAGTESAREHPGYLEGALESAERVSDELRARS